MKKLNSKWEKVNGGLNQYIQKEGWHLSYNDSTDIGIFDCSNPELAIYKNGKFAIINYDSPQDFEDIESYEDAIALAQTLIDNGDAEIADWNEFQFNVKKPC